jgi:hypothetical protein
LFACAQGCGRLEGSGQIFHPHKVPTTTNIIFEKPADNCQIAISTQKIKEERATKARNREALSALKNIF